MYDSRLGRWLSLDPAWKVFPWIEPYNAFANDPLYYIDEGGETLKVAFKNEAERVQVQTALQKLTNDKVEVMADGSVTLTASNQNPDKKLTNGTQLLRDVDNHTKTTTITVNNERVGSSCDYGNKTNAANGVGCDANVEFTTLNGSAQYSQDGKTVDDLQADHIALANELIHALIMMDGNSNTTSNVGSNHYTNIYGDPQVEYYNPEELAVHLDGNYKVDPKGKRSKYINENDIRREQGLPVRVAYSNSMEYWKKYHPDPPVQKVEGQKKPLSQAMKKTSTGSQLGSTRGETKK